MKEIHIKFINSEQVFKYKDGKPSIGKDSLFKKIYIKYNKSLHYYWSGGIAHRIVIRIIKLKVIVFWGTSPIRIPKIFLSWNRTVDYRFYQQK